MSRYQYTPQALDDLLEIWSFIARDNTDAADRLEVAVFHGVLFLPILRSQAERGVT
jgi:plasmid stabilization system protein ParE